MYCMIGCLLLSVQNKGLICFETRIRFASKQGFVLFPNKYSFFISKPGFVSLRNNDSVRFETMIRSVSKQGFGPFRNKDPLRFETRIYFAVKRNRICCVRMGTDTMQKKIFFDENKKLNQTF